MNTYQAGERGDCIESWTTLNPLVEREDPSSCLHPSVTKVSQIKSLSFAKGLLSDQPPLNVE